MQPTQQAAVHLQNEGPRVPDLVRASFVFWAYKVLSWLQDTARCASERQYTTPTAASRCTTESDLERAVTQRGSRGRGSSWAVAQRLLLGRLRQNKQAHSLRPPCTQHGLFAAVAGEVLPANTPI